MRQMAKRQRDWSNLRSVPQVECKELERSDGEDEEGNQAPAQQVESVKHPRRTVQLIIENEAWAYSQ